VLRRVVAQLPCQDHARRLLPPWPPLRVHREEGEVVVSQPRRSTSRYDRRGTIHAAKREQEREEIIVADPDINYCDKNQWAMLSEKVQTIRDQGLNGP
jgi:hypothetical protein